MSKTINYSTLKSSFDSPLAKQQLNKKFSTNGPIKEINKITILSPFNTDMTKFEINSNIIFDKPEPIVSEVETEWKTVLKKESCCTK